MLNENGKLVGTGPVIDKQYNVIRGQTNKGAFILTSEDFENMQE